MKVTTTASRTARTEWFRRASTWPLLGAFVANAGGEPHAYIAGVASGEEAYSLAMLLEHLGVACRITATDVDAELVAIAERPRWTREEVREACAAGVVPVDAVTRHLVFDGDGFTPAPALRERIDFGVADLRDAHIASADVVMARNLWRHLGAGSVAAAENVATSLKPGGLLSLGGADFLHESPRGLVPSALDGVLRGAGLRPVGVGGLYFQPPGGVLADER